MELMDQSEKLLFEKCKYKVKVWEHTFKKANGRIPSRLDIKEADYKVRDAYKTYFRLKTAALEKSFMGIDGFHSDDDQTNFETEPTIISSKIDENIDTNTSPDTTWGKHLNKSKIEKPHNEPMKPAANLNQKFVSKLSIGSKLIKRNPRKSLSQSKISNNSIEKPKTTINTPISLGRSFSEPVVLDDNSEDFVSLVDTTQLNTQNIKIVSSNKVIPKSINIINDLMKQPERVSQNLRNVDVRWLERVEKNTGTPSVEGTADLISDEDIIEKSDDDSDGSLHVAKRFKYSSNVMPNLKILAKQSSLVEKPNPQVSELKKISNENEIPESTSECIPSINANSTTNSVVEKVHSECSMPQLQSNEDDVKEIESLKSNSTGENKKINTNESDVSSFKKRNLNENFLRINLKKKVYARGKKTMNFSTYKKKLWKNKKKFIEDMEEGNESSKPKFGKLMPLVDYNSDDGSNNLETLDEASGEIVSQNSITISHLESDDEDDLPLAVFKGNSTNYNKESTIDNLTSHENPTTNKYTDAKDSNETTKKSNKPKSNTKNKINETDGKKQNKVRNSQLKSTKKQSTGSKVVKVKTDHIKRVTPNTKSLIKENDNELQNEGYDDITEIEFECNMMEQTHQQHFNDEDDFNLLLETIRMENTIDMRGVYPLYSAKDDGSIVDTPPEVFDALRLFGHDSFREGQEKAVMRILSGKSTLVTSSTGSGKSLCYQLPAYLFRQKYRCICLIISPLISLMEDQIKCMPAVLKAVCLHGNQTKSQRDMNLKALTDGDVSILMVSPESILSSDQSYGFGSILSRIPPIAFACLDEAHCLSQWSHNFRPSYLVVCQILQEKLGIKTILGLTATATQSTRESLIKQLQISDGEDGVIKDTPIPGNLKLTVSRDMNREQALLELLLSKPFCDFTSIIIYCLRRNDCESVASFLRASLKDFIPPSNTKKRKRISNQVESYHAGLSGAKRKTIQNAFTSGELRIVVATVAFGMGINKADIRSVIHYNMPASFESYVQEIGRAGRDRLPAHCHIFLDRQNADVYQLRRHIYGNSVDRHIIRKLLRKVFIPCKCEETCIKHEILFSVNNTVNTLDVSEEVISTLLCYLELHQRKYIKVLKQTYGKCKVTSYGGNALLHKTALTCEPLKCAIQMDESDEKDLKSIEFSVMKVSKKLNYDTGICKQILKNLEWANINGQPKRTALNVEFSDLSFHLLSPGNLPDEDLDDVLDTLYNKVIDQENIAYAQLIDIDQTLSKVALRTCKNLVDVEEKSEILKKDIREYFESKKQVRPIVIPKITEEEKNAIINDIKLLIYRYGDESFTARSIARIFHGIPSPNFPPKIWGRTKFWRAHLKVHFNTICKIATSELIKNQS